MPRYFFDIQNGDFLYDDEGTECLDFAEAREKVVASLQDMAGWITPAAGDNQSVVVKIRDERGNQIYKATLKFVGTRSVAA